MKVRLYLLILLSSFIGFFCGRDSFEIGTTLMNKGNYREAITEFLKIDSTNSKFIDSRRVIAKCYLELLWKHCLEFDFENRYNLDPTSIWRDTKEFRPLDSISRKDYNNLLIIKDSLNYYIHKDSAQYILDSSKIDFTTDTTWSNYQYWLAILGITPVPSMKYPELREAMIENAKRRFQNVRTGRYVSRAKEYLNAQIAREEAIAARAAQIRELLTVVGDPYPNRLKLQTLPKISNLQMSKDLGTGSLTIHFNLACPEVPEGRGAFSYLMSLGALQFRVRLFDRNGNYLTHFNTEYLSKLFPDAKFMSRKGKQYSLIYEVNMRDLRDAEIGELGLIYLH